MAVQVIAHYVIRNKHNIIGSNCVLAAKLSSCSISYNKILTSIKQISPRDFKRNYKFINDETPFEDIIRDASSIMELTNIRRRLLMLGHPDNDDDNPDDDGFSNAEVDDMIKFFATA